MLVNKSVVTVCVWVDWRMKALRVSSDGRLTSLVSSAELPKVAAALLFRLM